MAEKSRLAEVLAVEEDEEYTVKDGDNIVYRIHNGDRQYKDALGRWHNECSENTLTMLINDPSLIQRKPRFTDEEMTVLRWLHKHAKLRRFYKTIDGHIGATSDGIYSLDGNIAYYLLKPGEAIDLDELFKEDKNG